ncbi:Protein CIP2A -like protein [Collichthys lucidus]|uniref:Protein CIP2A-like protein n=1 Tax=Collichthys lucidus TaxID=240159 RepID=A0A4U5VH75_COLLU|nr:Protein CIP2A -like protein [Collichthys lucidus]
MDMTTCLKSLLLAIQEYRGGRTAQSAAQLLKQVKEVSGLKCDQLLSSGQVLPSECVSGLVELVGNPNTSPNVTSSIISLLAQLACGDDSREILHSSYNLTSILASVIHYHRATPEEPLVLQCLQVLQKLTYNTRIFQSTNYIHELIAFLVTNIQSNNDDIIMLCLGLMANLCRDNHSVQSHIKTMDNVKSFYRTLIDLLAHNSLTVVVFTLSILASLIMNEKVGEKLFDAKNIYQTFQLVFNIIVNGDACVAQVLRLLHFKDPDSAAKVLELLLAMCSVSGLRSQLCTVVFRPAAPKLRAADRKQGAGLDAEHKAEPGLALAQWLSSPVEGAESCSLQVLQLLNELLQEALAADGVSDCVLSFVDMLLPVLLGLLKGLDPSQGDAHQRKHCHRITRVTTLTRPLLCSEDSTRSLVSRQVSAQLCLSQVESLLSCCHSNSPLTCLPPGSDNDLSLGESIAANNSYRRREAELSVKRVAVQDVPSSSMLDTSSRSVHSLTDKMQSGLELQEQVKDSHVSDIIEVYEQKLLAFASKESRLQDLLEAKALALSQADRLIAQYRFQRAQTESELCKLGSLLKDAERNREDLQGQLSNQVLEVECSKADIEELLQHNTRLQHDSEEHQVLKGAYNALLSRFNESERLLKELQAAHTSLTKQAEGLKKNHDALQLKHEKTVSVLEEREEEIRSLSSDLQQKNGDIAGLRAELRAEEEKVKEKDHERRELEDTVDVLRKELNKTEQARKDASIKASSLELQKSQLETKLKQKEDELNKHSAMISMIHSLSSGKMKSDVNLSL